MSDNILRDVVDLSASAPGTLPSTTGNDGYALIEVGGIAAWRPILEAYIVPAFDISAFSATAATLEVGATATTPAFTASYTEVPTAATLTDNQGTPPKDVSGTPNSFSSNGIFTKTTNNDSATFTLNASTATENDNTNTALNWRPRTYYGVDVAGLSTEADIEGLSNSQLDNNRNISFTVNPGASEYIYYSYPTAYGTATFTVNGFVGGFEAPLTISVTNTFGVTQDYYLYRSTNANLGSTTVAVS